jgi:hypothetical protein
VSDWLISVICWFSFERVLQGQTSRLHAQLHGPRLSEKMQAYHVAENIPPVLLNGDPPAHSTEEKAPGQSMFRQLAEDEFFDVPEDSAWDLEVPDLDESHTGTSDEDQVSQ